MILFNKKLGIKYYTVDEIDRIINKFTSTITGRGKHKYIDIATALDIETTNFIYNNNKLSMLYHHQIGLMSDTGFVYCLVGKTETELIYIINKLNNYAKQKKAKLILFVHNLSFEYFFLRGLLDFDDYFVTRANNILYAIYDHIEFRCSYLLSGCSLSTLTDFIPKETNLNKLVGALDYNVFRTPENCNLTDLETAYCLNDVRIVCKYIKTQIDEWGSISQIPYTKTSGATKKMSLYCMPKGKDTMSQIQKKRYIRDIAKLKFHSGAEFICAVKSFMGGHTNANPVIVNKTLENITAWDYISSYSGVCCYSCEFPNDYIDSYSDKEESFLKEEINLNHAFICQITLYNVKPKKYVRTDGKEYNAIWDSFIPSDKCEDVENLKTDRENGKVISADKLTIYCNNLDYEVYKLYYDFTCKVNYIFTYTKSYLPRPVIEFILYQYSEKTKLKNVEGKEIQYNLSKEILNSCSYGVHVKSPMKEVLQFNEEEEKWQETFKGEWLNNVYDFHTVDGVSDYYYDKCVNYNRRLYSGQIIIPYIAAIFIPSIARLNIAYAIFNAGRNKQYNYSDTDSIYTSGDFSNYIKLYNNNVKLQFDYMCKFYGFDSDVWRPKNDKGEEKPLGYFALDGHYKYMKVLRPKTYITIDDKNELHTTIAGLGKDEGAKYLADFDEMHEEYIDNNGITHYIIHDYKKVFDAFKIGMKVPADRTGKLHHQIFRKEHKGEINGYKFDVKGGVYLENEDFEIKNDSNWEKLLRLYTQGYDQLYYK